MKLCIENFQNARYQPLCFGYMTYLIEYFRECSRLLFENTSRIASWTLLFHQTLILGATALIKISKTMRMFWVVSEV